MSNFDCIPDVQETHRRSAEAIERLYISFFKEIWGKVSNYISLGKSDYEYSFDISKDQFYPWFKIDHPLVLEFIKTLQEKGYEASIERRIVTEWHSLRLKISWKRKDTEQ